MHHCPMMFSLTGGTAASLIFMYGIRGHHISYQYLLDVLFSGLRPLKRFVDTLLSLGTAFDGLLGKFQRFSGQE